MKHNIVILTDSLDAGGIETFVVNVCRYIDKDMFNVYVLVTDNTRKLHEQEIVSFNCTVDYFPPSGQLRKFIFFAKYLHKNKIKLVHFQVRYSYLILLTRIMGRKSVLHSHFSYNNFSDNLFRATLYKLLLLKACDKLIACGDSAGLAAFGSTPFEVVYNGIDVDEFSYNEEARDNTRRSLGIKNQDIVILQVGRINKQKNQQFSLQLLLELNKLHNNYKLIFVGYGEDFNELNEQIHKVNLEDRVFAVGDVKNPSSFYSTSDILLQPSLSEGFPYTIIESQASGVDCLISDNISDEVAFTNRITRLPLGNKELWVDKIIEIGKKKTQRDNLLINSVFDIENSVNKIKQIYLGALGENYDES